MEVKRNLPPDEYHSSTEFISNSMLKVFAESRRVYEARFITKTLAAPRSKAMDIGTVAHAAILEPHIIDDCCLEIPDSVLSSSGSRAGAKWKDFQAEHTDKILLDSEELTAVRGMFAAVYRNPMAARLLRSPGECEESIFWECGESGMKRRARLDKRITDWGIIDVKTSHNVSGSVFGSTAATYGYHYQNTFYADGYRAAYGEEPRFVFIAVERKPPHLVRCYAFEPEEIAGARSQVIANLIELRECMASGDWADAEENEIQPLKLPRWAKESAWQVA